MVVKKNYKKAFNELGAHWPAKKEDFKAMAEEAEKQLGAAEQRFGKVQCYELIATHNAGSSLVQYSYLIKYEKHGIRWIFVYYRPSKSWLVNSVLWDDKMMFLFADAMK